MMDWLYSLLRIKERKTVADAIEASEDINFQKTIDAIQDMATTLGGFLDTHTRDVSKWTLLEFEEFITIFDNLSKGLREEQ